VGTTPLLLAACGSSSTSSSSSSSTSTTAASTSASASTGKKQQVVGKYLGTCKINECDLYKEKVNFADLKGVKIGVMGLIPVPGVTRFTTPFDKCIKAHGGETTYVNVNGDVSKAPAVLEGWLSQGYKGIGEDGVELQGYKSIREEAISKNVPIAVWGSGAAPGTVGMAADEFKDGELDAQYIGEQFPNGATVLGVSNKDQNALRERIEGAEYEFQKYPKIKFVQKTVATLTTNEAEQVTKSFLLSEPNIAAVIGGFTELALGAQTAIKSVGSKAFVVSGNGDPIEYEEIAKPGSIYKMTAADGHEFGGQLACEIMAATIAGKKPPSTHMLIESFGPITAANLPKPVGSVDTTPRKVYELPGE
jgi:ribose transport system substrate-binding protein